MTVRHNQKQIVLASSSVYRKELLTRLNLPFETVSPNVDETPFPNELPGETALRLAEMKARAVARLMPDAIIIGCDQAATLDHLHIGKPYTHQNALLQLKMLQGKQVVFHSALCVFQNTAQNETTPLVQLENCQTTVTFRNLPDHELDAYLHIEKPYDCAGSAKNEGLGIALLERVESNDPTALTGLPLISLTTMLRKVGVKFF